MADVSAVDHVQLNLAMSRWLSELTHEGMFATDSMLRVTMWNRWMQIHTRLSADDVMGRTLFELYPDLQARDIDRYYRDALNGRVSVISRGLHRFLLPLPPTIKELPLAEMPQSGHIGPLFDGETVIGTVTTIEDVSERLAAEVALRRQIDAETEARAAAESALRAKDDFLSTLSHELRQPLNAVLGWTRILMMGKSTDPQVTARALEVIARNATAQAAMIDDILDVARIVTGKLRLDLRPTDLLPVVLAAVDVVSPSATAKHITLRTALDPRTPIVLGDAPRLQQVVWNLMSNAVKFTEPGGSIDVKLGVVNTMARLTVIDTGCGISPQFLPFVFDRFRQSDASSTRRQGGLGLGLALVRDLVALHGGRMRAESPGEGQGAAFTIELPIMAAADTQRRSVDPLESQDVPSLAGVKALVVDDETDARDLAVAALVQAGAEVEAVSSCDEAMARLQEAAPERPFGVIVSDIGMPEADGYELMRRVRALDKHLGGETPAIAVTGYANPDDRDKVLAVGYQLHVSKPIAPLSLARAVRCVVPAARNAC